MSNRVKGHFDHTNQSVFYHGLIKLIICTVLKKKNRSWDQFSFWSGFTNEHGDHVKKILTNKQFGFIKRFKKEVFEDLVQDNLQENSFGQGFRDTVDEDRGKALDDDQEHSLKNEKMEKTYDLNLDEDIGSTEHKQSFICV